MKIYEPNTDTFREAPDFRISQRWLDSTLQKALKNVMRLLPNKPGQPDGLEPERERFTELIGLPPKAERADAVREIRAAVDRLTQRVRAANDRFSGYAQLPLAMGCSMHRLDWGKGMSARVACQHVFNQEDEPVLAFRFDVSVV